MHFHLSATQFDARSDCLDAYKWVLNDLNKAIKTTLDTTRVISMGGSAGAISCLFLVSGFLFSFELVKQAVAKQVDADFYSDLAGYRRHRGWNTTSSGDLGVSSCDRCECLLRQTAGGVSSGTDEERIRRSEQIVRTTGGDQFSFQVSFGDKALGKSGEGGGEHQIVLLLIDGLRP